MRLNVKDSKELDINSQLVKKGVSPVKHKTGNNGLRPFPNIFLASFLRKKYTSILKGQIHISRSFRPVIFFLAPSPPP